MANFEISVENLNEIEREYREETFINCPYIKHLAAVGLFVRSNGNISDQINFLVCHHCKKEVEILKNVEKLEKNLFHYKNCEYFQNLSRDCETVIEQTNYKMRFSSIESKFCNIEHVVSEETVNMSLDSILNKVLRCGFTRDIAYRVLIERWRELNKDYDSFYEMLIDMKNYKPSYKVTLQNMSAVVLAEKFCVVCMFRNLEIVFLPCGHLCVCNICSLQITECPICRKHIQRKVSNFKFNYCGIK